MSQVDTPQLPFLDDTLDLAQLLETRWPGHLATLRASGVPLNAEDGGGDGGDGKGGEDGAKGGGDGAGKDEGDGKKKPPWESDEKFDPERAWNLIQVLRGDLDKVKTERDDLKGKVQKHEDASKTDQQKLEERATGAEQRATKAEAEAARLRVALKKGLTETQAKRLVGDDEEALEKDADDLLASFKQEGDERDQESRGRPKERLRPGAAPSAEPDENDPAKLASKVSRGW